MLKFNLTTDEYTALSDDAKTNYIQDGDNYKLQIDGLEDTGALKRAKDREAQAAKEAREEAARLKTELDAIKEREADADKDSKRKKGDIEALERSWKETADRRVADIQTKLEAAQGQMQTLLVGNVAQSIASELFTTPEIAIDFVSKRLKAEFDGDTPITRVLDSSGHPSALTIDEFKKELLANPKLAGILVASKASGGGAGGGSGSGGGASTKKLADMNHAERLELYKTNPTVFNQLVEASKG